MYQKILVPVEHTATDSTILRHVRQLATHDASTIILIHVADGFAARNIDQLDLRESEEMRRDRAYLDACVATLVKDGFRAEAVLACGDPAREICAAAERERVDLIAMATHGHRFLADLIYGSVADAVRHKTMIPVLLVREAPDAS